MPRKKKPSRRGAHFSKEHQSRAGRARMAKLTPEERSELARLGWEGLLAKYGEARARQILREAGEAGAAAANRQMLNDGYFPNQSLQMWGYHP